MNTMTSTNPSLMRAVLSRTLTVGTFLAAALVILGFALTLASTRAPIDHSTFVGEPNGLNAPSAILRSARALSGPGIMQLGVVVLLATPVLRVLFAAILFGRERDWLYVVISLIVLGGLALGMVGLID